MKHHHHHHTAAGMLITIGAGGLGYAMATMFFGFWLDFAYGLLTFLGSWLLAFWIDHPHQHGDSAVGLRRHLRRAK